jgi:hypothetical protein
MSLTVAKATSKISLALSATKVTFGHEQAEHLSASVTPEFAGTTPAGAVSITSAGVVICTMILSHGRGSCTLSPKRLAVGSQALAAHYAGSDDFGSSVSPPVKLAVGE